MSESMKRTVAIIGGGPAGLMAAEVLSRNRACQVTVFDAMPSLGRKFLMAGRGGLNLTHSEPFEAFMERYGARAPNLRRAVEAWSPSDVRSWCEALGQETFVGSSGRVFPKIMKASGLLRAWLRRLDDQGVTVNLRHRWQGWDEEGRLLFDTPNGEVAISVDASVLALGGASWPRLGSDGSWCAILQEAGIEIAPLLPANVGFQIDWSEFFRKRFEGQPLKSIAVAHGANTTRGEAIITASGIEGGAIYAIASHLRDDFLKHGRATLTVDLKPNMDQASLSKALSKPRGKQSMATYLRKNARLSPIGIGLLQEAAIAIGQPLSGLSPDELAVAIKSVPLTATGVGAIDRAISSAGGVQFDQIDERFMLRQCPGVFVAGEMLDWEAPTGGYLLQACFATGAAAGRGASEWLDRAEITAG
jgi:uncharacterized flavoprotein (TIGR03862 family)